jgi:hypothetical protein
VFAFEKPGVGHQQRRMDNADARFALPFPPNILMEDIMKKLLGAVSALALFASAGLAMAEDVTGTLLEIDEMAQTITLEDGTTYTVGEGVILEGFEPGQEVTVSLEEQEGQEVVIFIEPAMAEPDGDDEPVVD